MCNCNKKSFEYIRNLALKLKSINPDKQYAIYKISNSYSFTELQFAKDFNIIEII